MNFAVRSSVIDVWQITNKDAVAPSNRVFKSFFKEPHYPRAVAFSDELFVYANSNEVKVYSLSYELKYTIDRHKRTHFLKFSSNGTFLIVYEIYTSTKETKDNPNLYIYEARSGKELFSFTCKKHSEFEPCISSDEKVLAIKLSDYIHFYELNAEGAFERAPHRLQGKVISFSMSPGNAANVTAFYGSDKGSPSMVRMFRYPNFDTPIATKSFSQADKVEMIWNKRGTGCLIMTTTEVDNSGQSYYGKQALHFLASNGDSYSVPFKGEGPIHCASWSPKSNQFVVVFGYMPASAKLFNMKCDVVFDFGTGIRNSVYWNQFGNLLLFGGFGNLRGNVEVWDMNKKKQVSATTAADTTQLEWSPSGDLYFTATTAPRLRQANGFKIWHYSGALLYENLFAEKQELFELVWQQYPTGFWKEPEITDKKVEGIQSVQPQASTKKYVPPNIRNFGEDSTSSNVTPPAQGPIPGLPPGYTSSAAAAKSGKKLRDQQRAEKFRNNKQQQNSADNKKDGANNPKTTENGNNKKNRNNNLNNNTNNNNVAAKESPAAGGDKEITARAKNPVQKTPREPRQQRDSFSRISKDSPAKANNDNNNAVAPLNKPQMSEEDKKKVSAIKKKLKDIKALKEKQEKGDKLDNNQLKKISIESDLNNELAALKLSA